MSERTFCDGEKWYADCTEIRNEREAAWLRTCEPAFPGSNLRQDRMSDFASEFRRGAIHAWRGRASDEWPDRTTYGLGYNAAVEWVKKNDRTSRWKITRRDASGDSMMIVAVDANKQCTYLSMCKHIDSMVVYSAQKPEVYRGSEDCVNIEEVN